MESRMREIRAYGLTRGSHIGGNTEAWVSTLQNNSYQHRDGRRAARFGGCVRFIHHG